MSQVVELYFDGACRGNGTKWARTGCGFVINGNIMRYKYLGHGTNNTAEYSGLIYGLKKVKKEFGTNIHLKVYGDSKLVIEQMNKKWRVKAPGLISLNNEAVALSKEFKNIKFIHVLREFNAEADRIAELSFN